MLAAQICVGVKENEEENMKQSQLTMSASLSHVFQCTLLGAIVSDACFIHLRSFVVSYDANNYLFVQHVSKIKKKNL